MLMSMNFPSDADLMSVNISFSHMSLSGVMYIENKELTFGQVIAMSLDRIKLTLAIMKSTLTIMKMKSTLTLQRILLKMLYWI